MNPNIDQDEDIHQDAGAPHNIELQARAEHQTSDKRSGKGRPSGQRWLGEELLLLLSSLLLLLLLLLLLVLRFGFSYLSIYSFLGLDSGKFIT